MINYCAALVPSLRGGILKFWQTKKTKWRFNICVNWFICLVRGPLHQPKSSAMAANSGATFEETTSNKTIERANHHHQSASPWKSAIQCRAKVKWNPFARFIYFVCLDGFAGKWNGCVESWWHRVWIEEQPTLEIDSHAWRDAAASVSIQWRLSRLPPPARPVPPFAPVSIGFQRTHAPGERGRARALLQIIKRIVCQFRFSVKLSSSIRILSAPWRSRYSSFQLAWLKTSLGGLLMGLERAP